MAGERGAYRLTGPVSATETDRAWRRCGLSNGAGFSAETGQTELRLAESPPRKRDGTRSPVSFAELGISRAHAHTPGGNADARRATGHTGPYPAISA